MGQKMCSRGAAGARHGGTAGFCVGAGVGALPWVVVGGVAAATAAATVGEGASERAFVCVGGGAAVTGGLLAPIVALPCAILGGLLGATTGGAQDLAAAAVALARATEQKLAAARDGRARAADRAARGSDSVQVAQMPQEALPLLCALVVARRRDVLSEEEAFVQASALASACGEGAPREEILARAEKEGREILTMVKLCEAYPDEKKAAVRAVARSLVERTDPDVVDAAWILCGSKPLGTWVSELTSRQPPHVSGVTPELMETGLRITYELERAALAEALCQHFPGGPSPEAYAQRLDELKEALPRASFWKGYCMFRAGAIPQGIEGLTFADICTDDFVQAAREFLSTSFALCVGELGTQDGAAAADPASTVMSAAVRASAPLAPPTESVAVGRSIHVEVLSVEHMGSAQYRLGDLTGSLVRSVSGSNQKRSPYVEVSLGSAKAQTRVVRNVSERADFGERLAIPWPGSFSVDGATLEVKVFDARGVQAAIRGDPLIGQATLRLAQVDLGESKAWTLQLHRGDKTNQGRLHVRIGVAASEGDYRALANTSEMPLAELARALAHVLSQPSGVDTLMETRPKRHDLGGQHEAMLRQLLRGLVARLRRDAELARGLGDEAALVQLARTIRAARQLVVICVAEALSGEEVQELAQTWIKALLLRCMPPGSAAPAVNEERLARLLQSGERQPVRVLEDFGARLPEGLPEVLREAVAARLAEALQAGEDEIFTGEPIFAERHVRPGMAAVIRAGRDHARPHVFLYDLASIQQWQAARGEDPSTRERLHASDIVPLS